MNLNTDKDQQAPDDPLAPQQTERKMIQMVAKLFESTLVRLQFEENRKQMLSSLYELDDEGGKSKQRRLIGQAISTQSCFNFGSTDMYLNGSLVFSMFNPNICKKILAGKRDVLLIKENDKYGSIIFRQTLECCLPLCCCQILFNNFLEYAFDVKNIEGKSILSVKRKRRLHYLDQCFRTFTKYSLSVSGCDRLGTITATNHLNQACCSEQRKYTIDVQRGAITNPATLQALLAALSYLTKL